MHGIYAPLIESIIKKYTFADVPITAIRAEAQKLLDTYIDSYNPSRGTQPKSWIQGNMQEKLKRIVAQNKMQRHTNEDIYYNLPKYTAAKDELQQEFGRVPTIKEITVKMKEFSPNITQAKVRFIHDNHRELIPASMNLGSDDDSSFTVGDISFSSEDPKEIYEADLKARQALNIIAELPELHQKVILHSYDIPGSGYPRLSLRNMALQLGLNRYRVSKILEEAENMLKDKAKERGGL